jgi:hypothetical protein
VNAGPDGSEAPQARAWPGFVYRRLDRIRAEVERNRRGEYVVPTWVLALILVLFVACWVLLVALA